MRVLMNIWLDEPTYSKPSTDPKFSTGFRRMAWTFTAVMDSFDSAYFELHGRKYGQKPTLVVVCDTKHQHVDGLHAAVDTLASMLNQDCIAFIADGVGALAGPKAAECQPFNPSCFIHPKEQVL